MCFLRCLLFLIAITYTVAGCSQLEPPIVVDDVEASSISTSQLDLSMPDASAVGVDGFSALDVSAIPERVFVDAVELALTADGAYELWSAPGDPAGPSLLPNWNPFHEFLPASELAEAPVFRVVSSQPGWFEVQVPIKPNGTTRWVRETSVSRSFDFDVVVVGDLSDRTLRVLNSVDGSVLLEVPSAIGKQSTPTPLGTFSVLERFPAPSGAYGRTIFVLSGFSEAIEKIGPYDAYMAIHGSNDPTSIGRASSNGCLRVSDEALDELWGMVDLGVLVSIVA